MADDRPAEGLVEMVARLSRELADVRSTVLARVARRPTGDIEPTLRGTPKPDTLILNGQTPLRAAYPGLWQWAQDQGLVIANMFTTGNGSTTFGVPDLRGRVLIGVGTLGSDTYALGDVVGSAFRTLTTSNMPAHTHGISPDGNHGGHFPGTSVLAPGGTASGLAAWDSAGQSTGDYHNHGGTASTGSGTSFDNRMPAFAGNWLIWT